MQNNNTDHRFFVICVVTLLLIFWLCLKTSLALAFAVVASCFAGYFYYHKANCAQPVAGIILLDKQQLEFTHQQGKYAGEITAKSYLLPRAIIFRLDGFYSKSWLIINASSVDDTDFARLSRAVIQAKAKVSS